jgi:hypothetical protein
MSLTLQQDVNLKKLAEKDAKRVAVSCYMALEPTGENPGANKIRLKNLLNQTKALLEERADDQKSAKALLECLEEIGDHEVFLETRFPGLGLIGELSSPKDISVFGLRIKPETRTSVGENYFLTPLIEDQMNESVMLVCLADNSPQFYRAHRGGLTPVDLPEDRPKSLADAKRFEESAGLDGNELYRNKTNAPSAGTRHGEGISNHVEDEFISRYLRGIGVAVAELVDSDTPILLAGVKEKLAAFRDLNPQLNILDRELDGNHESLPVSQIEMATSRLLAERLKDRTQSELKAVLELPEDRRVEGAHELEEAAKKSRIDSLFVHHNSSTEEFYDRLALDVLRNGGTVHIVDLESWNGPALAKLRW